MHSGVRVGGRAVRGKWALEVVPLAPAQMQNKFRFPKASSLDDDLPAATSSATDFAGVSEALNALLFEQLIWLDLERVSQPLKVIQRDVASLPFHMSHKGPVQASLKSKRLLRPALLRTPPDEIDGKYLPRRGLRLLCRGGGARHCAEVSRHAAFESAAFESQSHN